MSCVLFGKFCHPRHDPFYYDYLLNMFLTIIYFKRYLFQLLIYLVKGRNIVENIFLGSIVEIIGKEGAFLLLYLVG